MVRIGRRQLAFGLGASLLAAPFVNLLTRSPRASAAAPKKAKRLIVFFSPNGTIHSHWRPKGTETSFSFGAGSILEPLAAHTKNLLVIDGLDFKATDNHEAGMRAMLTGNGGAGDVGAGASVDQYIAREISKDSRFPSLDLGVQTSAWGASVQTRMSYSAPGEFVPPNDSPTDAFRRMFGDLVRDPGAMDAAMARKQSMIDLVRDEVRVLQGAVGAEEKLKLEQHLDAIRQLEKGLFGGGVTLGGGCKAPAVTDVNDQEHANFELVTDSMIDLTVAAAACGMTNVLSLQLAHTVAPHVFHHLKLTEAHHSLSHMEDGNAAGVAAFVKAERFIATKFDRLLTELEKTPEPDGEGSMLDNSVVMWSKELGDSRAHTCTSVPFILAGGAQAGLETGRYLKVKGEPHQKLLVSTCKLMGIDTPTFGDPSHGTGPLAGVV